MSIELKQVLKAIEDLHGYRPDIDKAIETLRAALQQPATATACGIPGMTKTACPYCGQGFAFEHEQPATGEPVWFHKHWGDDDDIFYRPDDNIPPGSVPLYTHPAPDVPEGYALVPIEPTAEMLQAALKVATPGALRAAWARMLAASPAQKGGKRTAPALELMKTL